MKTSLAIGLCSGTSADGVDAALVKLSGKGLNTKASLVKFYTLKFPPRLKEKIFEASHPTRGGVDKICHLNFFLGETFAKAALQVCQLARVSINDVSVIGSHGQTVYHIPRGVREGKMQIKSTLQIGEAAVIAERTGVKTVSDFRVRDIAAGGEGAPLVPYLHYLLLAHESQARSVHNIGGISNLTYLPPKKKSKKKDPLKDVIAFDTGPGNMIIDELIRKLTQRRSQMDVGGKIAAKGTVNTNFVKQLLRHPFINTSPPKSTGREEFGEDFVNDILRRKKVMELEFDDLIASVTAFTAQSIVLNYQRFVLPKGPLAEIIFCGGGAKNKTLIKMIQEQMPDIHCTSLDNYGIDADAVEAMSFAVYAYETLQGEPTNLPSVTGADHPVILGHITP
jgi:anhydro-N-acetylmuramic acid kinase